MTLLEISPVERKFHATCISFLAIITDTIPRKGFSLRNTFGALLGHGENSKGHLFLKKIDPQNPGWSHFEDYKQIYRMG